MYIEMPYSPSRYHSFRENYVEVRYLLSIYISVDWCNQKTASLYTYQSTYAIRKRHIIAVLHISKPWKWKKGGCCVLSTSTCPMYLVYYESSVKIKHTFYNVIQVWMGNNYIVMFYMFKCLIFNDIVFVFFSLVYLPTIVACC